MKTDLYCSIELVEDKNGQSCNLKCSHCYETRHDQLLALTLPKRPAWSLLPLRESLQALTRLNAAGFTHVNLEGGEPTLFRSQENLDVALEKIIAYGSSLGMQMILSTHGMSLLDGSPSRAERLISSGLKYLSLSLDGASAEVNNRIRVRHDGSSSQHFQKSLLFLEWYQSQLLIGRKDLFDLKINIVVRADNLEDLQSFGSFISNQITSSPRVTVKLVQVQPRGQAESNYSRLAVSSAAVEALAQKIRSECCFKVVTRIYDTGQYPFFVFTPSGYAVIPEGTLHSPVLVEDQFLDLRSSSFGTNLRTYLCLNENFQAKNQAINTYLTE